MVPQTHSSRGVQVSGENYLLSPKGWSLRVLLGDRGHRPAGLANSCLLGVVWVPGKNQQHGEELTRMPGQGEETSSEAVATTFPQEASLQQA